MTSKNKFDLALWDERLYIASDQLRMAIEEISALCSLRGVDLEAMWCKQLVCAAAHGQEAFQHIEEYFEAGSEPR
jgi:hypothetical protein